jgi:hypothetical protein
MRIPSRRINRQSKTMRQRLRRAIPGFAGVGELFDVDGGFGTGAAAVGIGSPAAGAPHTVQKAVPSASSAPHRVQNRVMTAITAFSARPRQDGSDRAFRL